MKITSKILICFCFILLIMCNEKDNDSVSWEEKVQLGKYRASKDNWEEITKEAIKEKKVVVLSNSSRVYETGKTFFNKYGIEVIGVKVQTGDLFEKLQKEHDSQIYDKDVVLCSNPAKLFKQFLTKKKVYSFVPRELEKELRYKYSTDRLSYYRFGGKALFYNSSYNKEAPINSWWDLTRPEWKGRILIKNLIQEGAEVSFLLNFIRNSKDMELSYIEEFSEKIKLNGTENAGYEYLKRLFENNITFTGTSAIILKKIAASKEQSQLIGISDISKYRYKSEKSMPIEIAWNLKPIAGWHSKQSILINTNAPHPNAAKLLIKWIFGNKKGQEGFSPFRTQGEWSVRKDVPPLENQKRFEDIGFWMQDEEWEADNYDKAFEYMKNLISKN